MPPTTRHTCWQGPLSEGKFLPSEHISLAPDPTAHPPALRCGRGVSTAGPARQRCGKMTTPCPCLFTGSPGGGSSPSWHWEQYFEFLPHTTQTPSHSLSTRKAGREDFPAFLNENLAF